MRHSSENVMRRFVRLARSMSSMAVEPNMNRYMSMLTLSIPAAITGMENNGISPKEMPDTMPLITPRVCLFMYVFFGFCAFSACIAYKRVQM